MVLMAPMNKQTAMALGPSVLWCSDGCASVANSGLFPGSRMLNTIMLMNVPMNCGSVVYMFRIPKYRPESSPVDDEASSDGPCSRRRREGGFDGDMIGEASSIAEPWDSLL